MTTPNARWTAGLTAVAAIAIAFGAWAKVDTEKLRAVNGPAAVAEGARQPTPRPGADANGLPEIPAARPSARPSDPTVRGGDRDGNRISDLLESRLGAAGPGERFDVIVMFDRPDPVGRARGAVGDFPLGREFSIINGFQAEMTAAQIRALSALPGVVRIEENIEVRAHDIYANDDTGATAARSDFGALTGAGVTICVLDTGINPDHELFDSKGLTADDFKDFTSTKTEPYDDHFHGSHVSGIAAGDGTPLASGGSVYAESAIGVAPAAHLKVGKVLDANGSGTSDQIIAGLEWCANQSDVQIINMSLGGGPTGGDDPMSVAANCAADPSGSSCGNFNGTPKIVVVSAGNSGAELGTVGTPGVAAKVITVASFAEHSGDATTSWQDDGVYLNPFSSRGAVNSTKPDIAGVGSRVISAYINDPANPSPTAYAVASGTSMSSPHVAGIVALMIEANPSLATWNGTDAADLPYAKVRAILKDTAVEVGPPGEDREYGAGLVDAYAAVATAAGAESYTATAYPLSGTQVSGTVPNNGTFEHPFTIAPEQVGLPVAAMMTIDGQVSCSFWCIISWWDPDLELIVEQDTGSGWQQVPADTSASPEVTLSTCPEGAECGSIGRVELVHFIPDFTGNYRFRVFPFDGDPNNGKGGSFTLDISMPATGSGGSDPDPDDPPTVSITNPAGGSTVSGTVTVSAGATDDNGVSQVEFFINGGSIGVDSDGSNGWSASWDTKSYADGSHTVAATATDTANQTASASHNVNVDNSTSTDDPPTVSVSSPADGALVTGTVTVTATAGDDVGVTQVEFFVDNGSIGTDADGSNGWSTNWTTGGDGNHTITANATDTADQVTESAPVSVTVDNTAPTVSITSHNGGDTVSGTIEVTASAGDANGVAKVQFFVDSSTSIGTDSNGTDGWSTSWDTTSVSDGDYTVSATATDDVGLLANSAGVVVTVAQPVGSDITLIATPNKARGRHHTILEWSNTPMTTGAMVDVYRDGNNVGSTADDGTHIDETNNRGGATYTFQICVAGSTSTSDCSDVETVVY